jgi:hypothetical protein
MVSSGNSNGKSRAERFMGFSLFCDLEGRKYRREDTVDPVVISLKNPCHPGGLGVIWQRGWRADVSIEFLGARRTGIG